MTDHSKLQFDAGLQTPSLDRGHKVHSVINAFVRRRCPDEPAVGERVTDGRWFGVEHFGLDRVDAFKTLSQRAQRSVVAECSRGLLQEAYYIEKAGVSYCAKLTVLAETTEERQAFSYIGADEATHLALVARYFDARDAQPETNPFVALLAHLSEVGDANSLVLMMQVTLEGWGLTHYRGLMRGCRDPGLTDVLSHILRDEALHHGAGKALYRPERTTVAQHGFIVDSMRQFLEMIRVGPQHVVGVLEHAAGGFTAAERLAAFEQLRCEAVSAEKLSLLWSLFSGSAPADVSQRLDDLGCFTPYDAQTCASITAG